MSQKLARRRTKVGRVIPRLDNFWWLEIDFSELEEIFFWRFLLDLGETLERKICLWRGEIFLVG